MSQAKRTSRGKRPSKAVSVLGIAGMSLAASTSGSPADIPPASFGGPTVGSVADMLWRSTAPFQIPALDDEEISDVSLATFHLFDNENPGNSGSGIQLALRAGCGGCGCGHGCGRLRRQGLRRRQRLPRRGLRRGRLQRLPRGRLRRLRLWWLGRLRGLRLGVGLGRLLLVVGRLRPLLDRNAFAITLTDASARARVRLGWSRPEDFVARARACEERPTG